MTWGESPNLASEPGDASAGGSAFGGQRPADAMPGSDADSSGSASLDDDVVDAEVVEGVDRAPESADRFPPEAGRTAEPGPESDPLDEPAPESDPILVLSLQRDEFRDALVRLQADFENYKKRMMKLQTDYVDRAAETLVEKLLPVLDTADLAMAHGGGEDVKKVVDALGSVLEREGLERIDSGGGPFDPTLHDAVAHEPGDGGQQEVAEVLRAGYRWKGRVLRPAMVKVRG